ncbi:MAG: DNA repair protein RecO C-terminal domain-containing protein [Alphaproteobacteria bacterium]|nr:DNA repair protein RecO C-terminal domain-containing protein [Alphaproteobacteria bacterium]
MQQGAVVAGIVLYQKALMRGTSYIEMLSEDEGALKGVVSLDKKKLSISGSIEGRFCRGERTSRMYRDLPFWDISDVGDGLYAELLHAPMPLLIWKSALDVMRVIREPASPKEIYNILLRVREDARQSADSLYWRASYVALELYVLQSLGFGLNIHSCAVTNEKENLFYISPKTGAAVVEKVGAPYADKLLPYPDLFAKIIRKNVCSASDSEFFQALDVTGFFLKRYVKRSLVREQIFVWREMNL